MSYTLKFSDPSKTQTVIVPDYVPGINTIDTSLSLVGKGYPAYGQKFAENFLHLLENFSSPIPPANPIEGQLWFDTSDPSRKVLRINDGTAGANWPSANGIYQQSLNPQQYNGASLKTGDIWVDTDNNLLKIYSGAGSWTTVGPSVSGVLKTGAEPVELKDSSDNSTRRVILNWADGNVISVISNGNEFTPTTYPSGMEGFTTIVPGITLTAKSGQPWQLQGDSSNSLKLGGVEASNYLQKNDVTSIGQVITGKVVFETPNATSPEGRDGLVIRVSGYPTSEYVQFYKQNDAAVIANNKQGGQIIFKTKSPTDSNMVNTVIISRRSVAINTSTSAVSPTLDVYGNARILSTLTVNNIVAQTISVTTGSVVVASNLMVAGITTATGTLHLGSDTGNGTAMIANTASMYDIGTAAVPFRNTYSDNIYATNIWSANYNTPAGTLRLWAGSTATNSVPTGWKVCNGTTATTATYVNLYNAIGYTYGKWGTGQGLYLPNLSVTSPTPNNAFWTSTSTYYIIKT
jgi:hypothetical protein